jgi:asparagine synthase (glutamine-hydrolysing)
MGSKYISLIKLGVIDPRLLYLSMKIRKSQKTFLGYPQLLSLAQSVKVVHERSEKPPQIAEFGVGRGGSATLLAWFTNAYNGGLTLFDVFDRIPPPTESDGTEAVERYQHILNDEGNDYYGNIQDLLAEIKTDLSEVCSLDKIDFIQGKYEDTLPELNNELSFNFVHIDCDWYESLRAVFDFLSDHVNRGAIIQIDDYLYWPGAKKATDEAEWLHGHRRKLVGNALVIDTNS